MSLPQNQQECSLLLQQQGKCCAQNVTFGQSYQSYMLALYGVKRIKPGMKRPGKEKKKRKSTRSYKNSGGFR